MLGGPGACPSGKKMKKNVQSGASWAFQRTILSTLKSTTLRITNQQQILFAIFFSSINPDVHVNKQLHFIRGVWGSPTEAKYFFLKNQTK